MGFSIKESILLLAREHLPNTEFMKNSYSYFSGISQADPLYLKKVYE